MRSSINIIKPKTIRQDSIKHFKSNNKRVACFPLTYPLPPTKHCLKPQNEHSNLKNINQKDASWHRIPNKSRLTEEIEKGRERKRNSSF